MLPMSRAEPLLIGRYEAILSDLCSSGDCPQVRPNFRHNGERRLRSARSLSTSRRSMDLSVEITKSDWKRLMDECSTSLLPTSR